MLKSTLLVLKVRFVIAYVLYNGNITVLTYFIRRGKQSILANPGEVSTREKSELIGNSVLRVENK